MYKTFVSHVHSIKSWWLIITNKKYLNHISWVETEYWDKFCIIFCSVISFSNRKIFFLWKTKSRNNLETIAYASFFLSAWFLTDEKELRRGRRWNPSVHTSEDFLRGPVIERDIRVVRKLTRVMKTQWNYNKPIARLIRSPGRRPFNNKTRTCPPRPYLRERTRVGSSCAEKGARGWRAGGCRKSEGGRHPFVWASPSGRACTYLQEN